MALERRNPLPPGRYWIDVFGDNRPRFTTWARQQKASVKVRVTESDVNSEPPREWHLFDVSAPVPWDAQTFGFPTVAEPEVQTSQDTVQRPPPEPEPDLSHVLPTPSDLATVGGGLGMLALIIAGAFLYMQSQKGRG